MSVGLGFADAAPASRLPRRLALMAGAIALAGLLVALLAWLIAPGIAAPPPRSPFGIGFREAAPAATGLGGVILALQASFSRAMNSAVSALKGGGDWTPLVGLAFAFGWTPCVGPVLASILLLAGGEDEVARGAWLLAAYAAGIGLPFVAAAFFTGPFLRLAGRFRRHLRTVEATMGLALVATGLVIFGGWMPLVGAWLTDAVPVLGRIG